MNQQITYTLEVSNLGADAAINLSVVDDLPSEVIYVTSSGTGWACNYDVPTHSVTCTRGNLAVGAAPDITITVTAPSSPATLQNTATVSALSSDPDPDNNSDSENTLITQSDPDALVKTLEDTSEDFTTGSNVAIGEVLTYEIVITIPPGTFDAAQLVDTLGQGLAFVDCDSINANPGLTTDITGGFPAVCSGAIVSEYAPGSIEPVDQGRQVSYNFGTLMNTTTDDTSLTVTYRAVVLDAIENQDGDTLTNSAQFSWDDGQSLPSANAGPVTVVEPDLSIQKTSNVTFVRVGDTVTFTITIRHTSESNADAFDVVIMDALPPGLQLLPASLVCSVGTSQLADADCTPSGNLIRAEWSEFLDNGISGVVRFQANVLSVPDLGGITNTSSVMWTSLPDDPGQISQYNALSTERTYDPGASSSITLNALTLGSALPATGFAPGVVTDISGLPQTLYSKNRDLTLEIPALKVDLPIVGVPLQNGNWDLTWLWKQAGWLEGSAYPSYEGNSVVTAHVYLPNGQPGPFIDIGTLSWGQELAVVSNGLRYIYQVREVSKIKPNDMSVFKHEDKPWLTLLTCKEYDEKANTYRSRLVVRAVLIRVEELKTVTNILLVLISPLWFTIEGFFIIAKSIWSGYDKFTASLARIVSLSSFSKGSNMNRALLLFTLLILFNSACTQKPAQLPPTLPLLWSTPTQTSKPLVPFNPQEFPLSDYGKYYAGKTTIVLKDPVDNSKKLMVGLYYPAVKTDDTGGVLTLNAKPDPSGAPYALILCSGKVASIFGTHLASHGFIVAGVEGQGTSPEDWGDWLINYPRQIISALDQLSKNTPEGFQGIIDTDNAGAMGYSFDGYTALALGGARVDPEQYKQRCANAEPSEKMEKWWIDYICGLAQEWLSFSKNAGAEVTISSDGLWKPVTDPRIRAVMPMAPEGAWLFGEHGLAAVDRPVLIISATDDTINYYDLEATYIYNNLGPQDHSMVSFVKQGHMMIYDTKPVMTMKLFAVAFFGDKLQGKSEYKKFYSEEFINQYSDLYWGVFP